MNPASSEQQQPLRAQIDVAQGQLGGLEQDLHAIDGELGRLATQREQYELLEQACGSLENLHALGAAELFWGQGVAGNEVAARVSQARQRVDGFLKHMASIEDRRHAVLEQLAQGREVLDILEDDLLELREQEEERRNEWVIEREVGALPERPAPMPWTRGGEDDHRFRKSLGWSLAAAVLLGLLMPLVDLPIPEPAEILEVPERIVQLIRREQQRPVPPAQSIIEEPRPEEPEPLPEPEPEAEPEPVVAEQPPPEQAPPGPAPAPEQAPRERAAASGILAFRESFSSLADNRPSARLGSEARISNAGDASVGRPERAMVTTQAPGSSGGINLGSLSRDVGGGGDGGGPQIAGVQTTRVASSIGPGGGGRLLGGGGGSGALAGRTDEEIQIVFDRYKASLYRLYNRELRNDPSLRGQMVLRLTIEPNGIVSMCELESSDMNAPALVQQVLERVRTFDFGAKDVAAITIVYPIDFLPAA
jgi:outer membrane biosynthesis protein TonB